MAADQLDMFAPAPPADLLDRIRGHAREVSDLDSAIALAEEDLAALRARRNEIVHDLMPDVMAEAGMDRFTLSPGDAERNTAVEFRLSTLVKGSWPSDPERREKAVKWLKDHDADGILKTVLTARFPRSEAKRAEEALALVRPICGKIGDATLTATVHPQTLAKFARERIESGEEVDLETLGVFTRRMVKVSGK